MVIGDIPPPVCAFGLLGPRGPFCMPLSTSSKPIVSLLPHFLPGRDITVRYDRYKAQPRAAASPEWKTNAKFCYQTQGMQGISVEGGMVSDRPIGVAGAGSIGCFVGGMFAASGRRVALLARPRVIREIEGNGLQLTSFEGLARNIASSALTLSEDPRILGDAGLVLVTVKSADTAGMADLIAGHAPADAVIVSLQNGVGNVAVLRQRLPGHRVLAARVPVQFA